MKINNFPNKHTKLIITVENKSGRYLDTDSYTECSPRNNSINITLKVKVKPRWWEFWK
jgi:hypothetical protein